MAQNRPRQKNEELHAAIQAFLAEVHEAFSYLESEYLYHRPQDLYDEHVDFQDFQVSVLYISRTIAVEIAWYITRAIIDVMFIELQDHWSLDTTDVSYYYYSSKQSIALRFYAEMLSHANDSDFLLKIPDTITGKKSLQRERMIQAGTKPIVEGLARATRKYAGAILLGDTSMFEKVRQYTHDR